MALISKTAAASIAAEGSASQDKDNTEQGIVVRTTVQNSGSPDTQLPSGSNYT